MQRNEMTMRRALVSAMLTLVAAGGAAASAADTAQNNRPRRKNRGDGPADIAPDVVARRDAREDGPLVSVVMPVYNRPELLPLALAQIGRTSYPGHIEIIVMDDSDERLDDAGLLLSAEHLRPERHTLVYEHLGERATVGEKRNMACALASGEIVVMMDDDDIYHLDRIGYQIEPILSGRANMTVLRQGVWLQLYPGDDDDRHATFFEATPRMARSVHYGTLAFGKNVWNPSRGFAYTNASLYDEVDFFNEVMASSGRVVEELPNNGMHVYVRHLANINRPGTDLATDGRFAKTDRPIDIPDDQVKTLERVVSGMNAAVAEGRNKRARGRGMQSSSKCGACVDVNGSCVTAQECWDAFGGEWGWRCTEPDAACEGCDASPSDVCEDRCVEHSGKCTSSQGCYDMYAFDGGEYLYLCDRFPSCDCEDSVDVTPYPSRSPTWPSPDIKCGTCVNVNGLCVSADECWDMYRDSPGIVWERCVEPADGTCEGCEKSLDNVCDDRCIDIGNKCLSSNDFYIMYAGEDARYCDRFPSCDCRNAVPLTTFPTHAPNDMPRCGACVDVNGPCVTADECWDMYSDCCPGLASEMCMGHTSEWSSDISCAGCRTSSHCNERCVNAEGRCESLADCYAMYSDSDIECDRFRTCDCPESATTDLDGDGIGNDGAPDQEEGDGLSDGQEVYLGTDPLSQNPDGDDDFKEDSEGTDPGDASDPTGDGADEASATDLCGDGATEEQKVTLGTDGNQTDTDKDGLADGHNGLDPLAMTNVTEVGNTDATNNTTLPASVEECVKNRTEEITLAGEMESLETLMAKPNMAITLGCCEGEEAATDPMCGGLSGYLSVLRRLQECFDPEEGGIRDEEGCECNAVLLAFKAIEEELAADGAQGVGREIANELASADDCCKEGTARTEFNRCLEEMEDGLEGNAGTSASFSSLTLRGILSMAAIALL